MSNNAFQNVPSLISRDASTAIKGLLMLLIIWGHVGMLNTNYETGEKSFIYDWLYTFHVHVFFILPFIYGYNKKIVEQIESDNNCKKMIDFQQVLYDFKHNVVRIGVPYCWFFVFYTLVFLIFDHGEINVIGILSAFIFGSQTLLSRYVGFNLLWFLPSMLALTTLKSVWYNSKKEIKIAILIISIILWTLNIFKIVTADKVGQMVPFAISQGFYYIVMGLASWWLIEKYSAKLLLPWVIPGIVILSIVFAYRFELPFNPYYLVRLIMPVLMFMVLFSISGIISKSKLLLFIGTYSLQIYLIHVFIINVLVVLFSHKSISLGICIYILATAISAWLSYMLLKTPVIKRTFFPQGK